jgi:hypothetical protein
LSWPSNFQSKKRPRESAASDAGDEEAAASRHPLPESNDQSRQQQTSRRKMRNAMRSTMRLRCTSERRSWRRRNDTVLTWCHRIYATLLSRLRDHGQSAFPRCSHCARCRASSTSNGPRSTGPRNCSTCSIVDTLGLFGFPGLPSLRWFLGELHHVEVGPHLRGPVRCLPPLSSDASAATLLNSMLCTAEEISAAYLRAGIILLPTAPRQSSATSHRVTLTT